MRYYTYIRTVYPSLNDSHGNLIGNKQKKSHLNSIYKFIRICIVAHYNIKLFHFTGLDTKQLYTLPFTSAKDLPNIFYYNSVYFPLRIYVPALTSAMFSREIFVSLRRKFTHLVSLYRFPSRANTNSCPIF